MVWTSIKKLADAILNDIRSGLRGFHLNMTLSRDLLEEEIVLMRLAVIKEYMLLGTLPVDDLLTSINCIPVDCKSLDKCNCSGFTCGKPTAHFQIPQLLLDFGLGNTIKYIGSSDRLHPYLFYTKAIDKVSKYLKYRKRGKNRPWVYIDVAPNNSGMLDCFIFEAPLIKLISITAVFKDPRLLEGLQCDCEEEESATGDLNLTFLDIVIKDRLTKQKINYYRQLAAPILPNDQLYNAG